MSRLRIHRSFEEELAKKADEFSLQPKAGSWNAIDQGVQHAAKTQKLWKIFGMGSGIIALSTLFILSTFSNKPSDQFAQMVPTIHPIKKIVSPKPPTKETNPPASSELSITGPASSTLLPVSIPAFHPTSVTAEIEIPSNTNEEMKTIAVRPKNMALSIDPEFEVNKPLRRKRLPVLPKDGWHIQASVAPGYGFHSLSTRIDNAEQLQNEKKKYDKGIQVFSAKVQARYHFTNRFSLAFGLAYTEAGEKIGIAPRNESPMYDNLAEQYGYDSVSMKSLGNSDVFTNQYRFIQVPVTLYFRKNLGHSRFGISTGFGLSFGYMYSNKSMVYDYRVEHYVDNPKFFRDWNVNAHIQSLLEFNLNTRWSLQAGPEVNYSLLSTYQNYYTLKQHQYSVGMNFGVQWKVFDIRKSRGQGLQ